MKRICGLIVAVSALNTAVAHADDGAGATLLDGSTTALIMGPTFIPDPSLLPGYIPTIDNLYLQELGFTGTDVTMLDTWGDPPFGKDILDLLGWGNLIDATTPNDLYPTDVFTVTGDLFGDYPVAAAELWVLGFFEHGDYMGLTESEIQAAMNDTATTVVDGLTTYYTIPDPSDLIATLLQT